MGELKSAFERALEKADGLGTLSPQEMRGLKEAEFVPVGRALAERYLGHGHTRVLSDEASRYHGEERDIVSRAALERLVEAIDVREGERSERALAAIPALAGAGHAAEAIGAIRGLLEEHRQAVEQRFSQQREQRERQIRELLHQMRIAGSAVGDVNPSSSDAWRQDAHELDARFDERLGELKGQLRASLPR
ncbi:MAG: hypothetical protein SV910_00410 [Chloroflexota bacterium]|nr:hypothetical protein [Chloroflexota bacterium]